MAFSSGKPRTSSPFRFHKPSSLNENIPGMFQHLAPMASSSHYTGSNLTSKTQSFVGRSLTPGRGRITSPASSATPQKYRFSSTSSAGSCSPLTPTSDRLDYMKDYQKAKESVLVTIRFRPLSAREIQRGDEVAWYADGDMTVRSEYNPGTAYGYDRVFGPATTTRRIYDTAARQVVQGAMEGINGTVFAYGVTSSGKTHTMHGDHKSPGIIPLAVKDVFSIIQETPGREFLLRVSYLEIYNEIINDLLDPVGQNLRVREDSQGTYVEGIKEEVVLSPAHALSLITAGEEHRHVGSNNFNLFSSRSHTIFTLTIESSASTSDYDNDEITLSQLNLIDLAGSESSKTETTGLRRKEGSYINKSLLTLGTVISKLSDGKASHVPYRDSKLTRLLQSSLSGHGRVSLICTITPASSNAEETHNTLKFAHRAKRMEIYAAPNRIMDEKSLIKKYQKEISSLKHELDQLKRGILDKPYLVGSSQEDLLSLRQQLEAGQVKLQSRLEEEEQAKAALMGRIQRLTKLILVSSKNSIPATLPEQAGHRRRHSFGEEELAYLTDRRHGLVSDANDNSVLVGQNTEISIEGKGDGNGAEEAVKEEKKTKRRSMLAWFKHRKNENFHLSPVMSFDAENSPSVSPASIISTAVQIDQTSDCKGELQKPTKQRVDGLPPVINSFPQATQAGELFSATVRGRRPPPTGETMADQMDLLREQVKMLAGEVALCTSSLKRLSEQAASNPDDIQIRSQMQKTRENIEEKTRQIQVLEQRILGTGDAASNNASSFELSQTISKLMSQLNEKAFELEIKTADNRILQEQLQAKISENGELQETIASLRQQLTLPTKKSRKNKSGSRCSASCRMANGVTESCRDNEGWLRSSGLSGELEYVEEAVDANESDSDSCSSMQSLKKLVDPGLQSQMLMQAAKLERLKQEKVQLMEEKEGLRIQAQKLAEEASYAKELASAAAVELKNLAEEVTKLSFQNSKLVNDLAIVQDRAFARATAKPVTGNGYAKHIAHSGYQIDGDFCIGGQADGWIVNGDNDVSSDFYDDIDSWKLDPEDLKRELHARKEREAGLEAVLADKEQIEAELHKKLEEAKQREADLENDLAGMWVLVGKLKKEREAFNNFTKPESYNSSANDALRLDWGGMKVKDLDVGDKVQEDLRTDLEDKRRRCAELETLISQLKSEELDGLDASAMDDLQSLHVEALTKLCQAKARKQERLERDREREPDVSVDQPEEERNGHICKVCFEAPTAAVLLPCRHFCLCKPCAVACTECPLCRSGIADIIITFTS